MKTPRFAERDIDRLFAGHSPADGDLARIVPLVAALRPGAGDAPAPGRVVAMAAVLAAEARDGATAPAARRGRSVRRVDSPLGWGRRLTAVGGVAVLVTAVGGGVAAAANGSAPGDVLYRVDQAFEAIGIGNGGTGERLTEASRLANRGSTDAALDHAAKALGAEGQAEGAVALEEAATAVAEQGSEQSAEVRTAVADMLDWMAKTDSHGRDFGQGVSDRAHTVRDTARHGEGMMGPADPDGAGPDGATPRPVKSDGAGPGGMPHDDGTSNGDGGRSQGHGDR